MMKRFLILAVVRILFAALPVGAAAVYPSSPSNYLFSTPLWPAHIRGDVMGTPPAYRVPRSEDVDWIAEAYGERAALANGEMPSRGTSTRAEFGVWPLSETNRFYRWATAVDASGVTNVVVGYNIVTNDPASPFNLNSPKIRTLYGQLDYYLGNNLLLWNPTGDGAAYLDPDATLSDVARAYKYYNAPSFTNTYLYPKTETVTTNSTSTIEMPMTNGTVSVYTNHWSVRQYLPAYGVLTKVATARPLDFCHVGAGQFPGFTNSMNSLGDLGFSPGVFSNLYCTLRGATRLADTADIITRTNYISISRQKHTDGSGSITTTSATTNSDFSAAFYFDADGRDSYSWNSEKQEWDVYDKFYVSKGASIPHEAVLETRFKSELVTTGGASRVTIEAAFAVVEFEYDKYVVVGEPPYPDTVLDVYVHNNVVIPLANFTLYCSTTNYVMASVYIDMNALCNSAASASGVPSPPENPAVYVPQNDEDTVWKAGCERIVLIYKLHPSSKFNDWD